MLDKLNSKCLMKILNTLIDPTEIDIIPGNDQEAEEGIDLDTDLLLKSLQKCLIFNMNKQIQYDSHGRYQYRYRNNSHEWYHRKYSRDRHYRNDSQERHYKSRHDSKERYHKHERHDSHHRKIYYRDEVGIAMTDMKDQVDQTDQTIFTEIEVKIDTEEMIVMTDIDLIGNNMVEITAMKDIQKEIINISVSSVIDIMMHYTVISYKW